MTMMRTEIETRRKRYAMQRLSLAMKRLIQVDSADERIMATRWVVAWGRAVGERRFEPMWHESVTRALAASARHQSAANRAQ
ncbi:hypothetical protein [Paraburkholderia pallida]|uniref:Conjugal transfer protein TraD n=1 Tax=Paraburkholderia pallida TaxID=2547399 RepID=A0A4P7CZT3_9BURK|nr:hypothetical protein [Paraburkholderia pallida]QBR01889.1 hypothetical protein E1956_32635 [Paraburkholderia pallida]